MNKKEYKRLADLLLGALSDEEKIVELGTDLVAFHTDNAEELIIKGMKIDSYVVDWKTLLEGVSCMYYSESGKGSSWVNAEGAMKRFFEFADPSEVVDCAHVSDAISYMMNTYDKCTRMANKIENIAARNRKPVRRGLMFLMAALLRKAGDDVSHNAALIYKMLGDDGLVKLINYWEEKPKDPYKQLKRIQAFFHQAIYVDLNPHSMKLSAEEARIAKAITGIVEAINPPTQTSI